MFHPVIVLETTVRKCTKMKAYPRCPSKVIPGELSSGVTGKNTEQIEMRREKPEQFQSSVIAEGNA